MAINPSKAENLMQIRAAVLSQMETPRPYAQTRPIVIETVIVIASPTIPHVRGCALEPMTKLPKKLN